MIEDFSSAASLLDEADSALDQMAKTAFQSAKDQNQLASVRNQISALRCQLPVNEIQSLSEELELISQENDEGRTLEALVVLRKLGLLKIRHGDATNGRKDLIKSLNRMVFKGIVNRGLLRLILVLNEYCFF